MTASVVNDSTIVKLPTQMLEALKQRAGQEGVSVNQLVETAIAHYLASDPAITPSGNSEAISSDDAPTSKAQAGDMGSWQVATQATAQARPLSRQEWETIAERWDAVNSAAMADTQTAAEFVADDQG